MIRTLQKWIQVWWPVVVIYTGVTFLSHQPKLPGPENIAVEFIWFKTGHLIVYATLGWFVCRALLLSYSKKLKKMNIQIGIEVIVIIGILASVDELHQMFIPGRGPHIRDVLIDILGASLAVLWWYTRYNRETPKAFFQKIQQRKA